MFRKLACGREFEVLHGDLLVFASRQEGCAEGNALNLCAIEIEVVGEALEVDLVEEILAGGRLHRQGFLPEGEALFLAGREKVGDEAQATEEGRVEVVLSIGREDSDAVELLDALEEIVDFDVGESYAGLLPITKDPHETRKLFFWYADEITGL